MRLIHRGVFAHILVAMLVVGGSVLLRMRTLVVPPKDFAVIVWNPGQYFLQNGFVHLDYPYPLWTPIVMLPLALGTPEMGAQLWFVGSLFLLATGVVGLMDLLMWPIRISSVVLVSLFVGAFGPVFTTLWVGQLNFAPFVALVLLAKSLKTHSWITAGLALGLGLIKPQLMALVSIAILSLAVWERYWKVLIGFFAVLAMLVAISAPFAVTPRQVLGGGAAQHLTAYLSHTSSLWGLSLTIAPQSVWLPGVLTVLLIGWLMYVWIDSVRKGLWQRRVLYLLSLTTIVNLIVLPYSWFYNQAMLIMPIMYATAQLLCFGSLARTLWLIVLLVVVYFLPTAVDVALTRVYLSEVYQVIPVICLLPVAVALQHQTERRSDLTNF